MSSNSIARFLLTSIALLGLAACGGGGGAKNQPPVAQFSVSPDRGAFPLPVTLDASASSDDSGISTYSWTFSDGSSATGVRVERTFTARGTYTATLTVTDSGGLTSTTAKTIEVLNNLAPEVSLSLSVADGVVPLTVAFDASATKDPENRALSFSWTLGDGNTATGATVNHVFDASNDYDVTLTVKDDVNQVQATRKVTVRLPTSIRVAGKVQLAAANLIDACRSYNALFTQLDDHAASSPHGDLPDEQTGPSDSSNWPFNWEDLIR